MPNLRARRAEGQTMKGQANILLERHLKELGLEFLPEYRFHPDRRWRSDYMLTSRLLNGQVVLLEIEGSVYARGRHTRGKGYENDMRKYNAAQAGGYYVLRFSTSMVLRGEAREFLRARLCVK